MAKRKKTIKAVEEPIEEIAQVVEEETPIKEVVEETVKEDETFDVVEEEITQDKTEEAVTQVNEEKKVAEVKEEPKPSAKPRIKSPSFFRKGSKISQMRRLYFSSNGVDVKNKIPNLEKCAWNGTNY